MNEMEALAPDGSLPVIAFARRVASRIIFMDQGRIVEDCSPSRFFDNPSSDRVRRFLSQVLSHGA